MFHVVLSGKIVTSDDKSLIKKIEDLIEQENGHIEGLFVSYEVIELNNNLDEHCTEVTHVSDKADNKPENKSDNDTD